MALNTSRSGLCRPIDEVKKLAKDFFDQYYTSIKRFVTWLFVLSSPPLRPSPARRIEICNQKMSRPHFFSLQSPFESWLKSENIYARSRMMLYMYAVRIISEESSSFKQNHIFYIPIHPSFNLAYFKFIGLTY